MLFNLKEYLIQSLETWSFYATKIYKILKILIYQNFLKCMPPVTFSTGATTNQLQQQGA